MIPLRYTLVADGSSDRCLVHVINWVLGQTPSLGALGFVPQVAPITLQGDLTAAVSQYPCDLLLVHRDGEGQGRPARVQEIDKRLQGKGLPPHICMVPVRMTEAWLLIEEKAIRIAADNPNGQSPLSLPRINELESLHDPKSLLWDVLSRASEKTGRRRDQFWRQRFHRRQRVAELISDFSPLRRLSAFSAFESDLSGALARWVKQEQ